MEEMDLQYRSLEPTFRRLEDEAKFILHAALHRAELKIHSITSRTKTLDSIRAKALRKTLEYPLSDLDDLVGVRVICLLRSSLVPIGDIVREQFEIISEDNKLDGAAVDTFGYQSVHLVVKLPATCAGPRYEGLHEQRFEVQLRTIAMHAWASLSHYLDYRNEPDVPKELRKDFFALSGLFYLADSHFELFYAGRQKSRESANQFALETPTAGQELNLDTLAAFLHKRYPDRRHADSAGVSELVGELVEFGYTSLDKLHPVLDASADAFRRYEGVHPPKKGVRFVDVGVVRISLGIVDREYAKSKYSSPRLVDRFRKFLSTS